MFKTVADAVSYDGDLLVAANEAAWTSVSNWLTSPEAKIGGGTRLTWIKTNHILMTGKQRDVNTVQKEVPLGPLNGTASVPWYQTVVLTHRTALARGRAHSGRIYPPAVNAAVAAGTPYISEADANGMATAWASCLSSLAVVLNDHAEGATISDWFPAVISPGDLDAAPPVSECKFQEITGVVCDRVPDVMHSRTKSVPRLEGSLKPLT